MSPDSYPTDRNRTDAVLDAYTTLLAEHTALMKACAQLIDDATLGLTPTTPNQEQPS